MQEDTIVALATAAGRAAVAIIRLSGPDSKSIALKLSFADELQPRVAHFLTIHSPNQEEILDKGLVIYFQAPNSFTGEEVVEFQVHGSPVQVDRIVKACIESGARLARPGEFSERAFMNHKMDLTQAEAIADLIAASSIKSAQMAMRSLQGDFSKKIHAILEAILYLRLYVEAALDFPEEEIDFLADGIIATKLDEVLLALQSIQKTANQGVILREGIHIVIAGKPNAGKSTLINALAGQEVAIVTDIEGTTRDVMREQILLDDIPIHLVDTAGLRESTDPVELEGIKRAWQEISKADCVLLLSDVNKSEQQQDLLDRAIREVLPENAVILQVFNKIDVVHQKARQEEGAVYLSAKTGEGLDYLKDKIKSLVGYQEGEGTFLARRRHLNALDKAYRLLSFGKEQLQKHRAPELLAEDLRLSHQSLCEITGEFSSDDLLGKIFSSFCIGK